jgi:hypothetical protein
MGEYQEGVGNSRNYISGEISRIDCEWMLSWIGDNGDLFKQQWQEFFAENSAEFDITCRPRPGYINLIATRKASA